MPAIVDMIELTNPVVDDWFVAVDIDEPLAVKTKKVKGSNVLKMVYPVGSIYISTVNTNPAALFGFGTWAAFGAGRCLVGVDAGDPDFDAAEKTSGSKTVALTESEMPQHSHAVGDPGHAHVENSNGTNTGPNRGWPAADASTNNPTLTGYSTEPSVTGITIGNAGGGQAHPNVQPSIAVYFWKRTA